MADTLIAKRKGQGYAAPWKPGLAFISFDMTIDEVRHVVHAMPFVPFTMHLADGRAVRVPHPDFIAVNGPGRMVIVTSEENTSWNIVDLLLVIRLEVHAPAPTTPS